MRNAPDGQRGSAIVIALMSLIVVMAAVLVAKGCESEPVAADTPTAQAPTFPPPPAVLPAPVAVAVEETAPEHAAATPALPGVPVLAVSNPCSQPLSMAVNVADTSGQRVNEGFFRVDPGPAKAPTTRHGPIYLHDQTVYFYTETLGNEPVETGKKREIVGDRQLTMKRVNLDPPAMTTITLECPGMTGY